MPNRSFVSAVIGYVVISFVIAILWHLVLFESIYDQIGYIARKEPSFFLGFLSMIVQGSVLAYLYPIFSRGESTTGRGVRFGLMMGIFFWSCHVLAAAAKRDLSPLPTFMMLESVFLFIQFTLAGLVLGLAYRPGKTAPASPLL